MIRVGTSTPRGYRREDLFDVWETYLPPPLPPSADRSATSATDATGGENTNVSNADAVADDGKSGATEPRASATNEFSVADVADSVAGDCAEKINSINNVADVADVAPPAGEGPGNGHATGSNREPKLGQLSARVTVREIRPPALGPPGDSLDDFVR